MFAKYLGKLCTYRNKTNTCVSLMTLSRSFSLEFFLIGGFACYALTIQQAMSMS